MQSNLKSVEFNSDAKPCSAIELNTEEAIRNIDSITTIIYALSVVIEREGSVIENMGLTLTFCVQHLHENLKVISTEIQNEQFE